MARAALALAVGGVTFPAGPRVAAGLRAAGCPTATGAGARDRSRARRSGRTAGRGRAGPVNPRPTSGPARNRSRCPGPRPRSPNPACLARCLARPALAGLAGSPAAASARPYGRILIFTLLDDRVTDFDRLAEEAAEYVRTGEPDTLVYVIHLVPNAPLQRIFYEIYRDRAAFDSHESQPYMQRFVAERRTCVLATNVIELRLKYAKVAPLPGPQPPAPAAPLPTGPLSAAPPRGVPGAPVPQRARPLPPPRPQRSDQPRSDQPRYDRPRYEQSGNAEPGYDQPGYDQPGYDQSRAGRERYDERRPDQRQIPSGRPYGG